MSMAEMLLLIPAPVINLMDETFVANAKFLEPLTSCGGCGNGKHHEQSVESGSEGGNSVR